MLLLFFLYFFLVVVVAVYVFDVVVYVVELMKFQPVPVIVFSEICEIESVCGFFFCNTLA